MSATNSTPNYDLPLFTATDKPTWQGDFNGAMTKIDTAIKEASESGGGGGGDDSEALLVANEAKSLATQANTTANAASSTATSASTTASAASTLAQSTQEGLAETNKTVSKNSTDISTIQSQLPTLQSNVTIAQNTATAARTDANTAKSDAATALSTAQSASSTASQAQTTASSAQSAAQTAQSTANSAQTLAQTDHWNMPEVFAYPRFGAVTNFNGTLVGIGYIYSGAGALLFMNGPLPAGLSAEQAEFTMRMSKVGYSPTFTINKTSGTVQVGTNTGYKSVSWLINNTTEYVDVVVNFGRTQGEVYFMPIYIHWV